MVNPFTFSDSVTRKPSQVRGRTRRAQSFATRVARSQDARGLLIGPPQPCKRMNILTEKLNVMPSKFQNHSDGSVWLRSHPKITSRYCAAMLFVFKARRRAHSRAYVTVAATPTDDRASKIGKLFLDNPLPHMSIAVTCSAMRSTLATGARLTLTRRGLAPREIHRALPGATTFKLCGANEAKRSLRLNERLVMHGYK